MQIKQISHLSASAPTKAAKVSVCVVTYNQEKYIRQCLQSIVDQVTDFDFEIIVADDCSTDGTREIINEFARKYPYIFRLFFHDKNIGALPNFRFVHGKAIGKYIAHMDGDDYVLPGKLQAQANFLDWHKTCNLLWTPVLVETLPGVLHQQNAYFREFALCREYTRADLIKYGAVGANSSKMYRRLDGEGICPDFDLIDYFVNVIQVGDGVACFTGNTPLGVYRLGVGIASSGSATKIITLKSIGFLATKFPECRLQCNVAALSIMLADVKNRRQTFAKSAILFLQTFHWRSIFVVIKELQFIKSLTFRSKDV